MKLKKITYWGIIAIIDSEKIKVVLKKTEGNDKIEFWSIIPDWVTSKIRDNKFIMQPDSNVQAQ